MRYLYSKTLIISLMLIVINAYDVMGQILPLNDNQKSFADSLRREFDNGPYFTLYRDNYFVVGTTPFIKPTADNSDVRFQISIAQRLTKSTLPWHTNLFLTYTQVVTWDVFKRSMPMHDFIFNPGIGLSKPFFSKDRYIGKATLLIEHMSNGKDSTLSRSWNRIALSGNVMIEKWLMVHTKLWIPIVDGENNRDILDYTGLWQTGVVVSAKNKKYQWGLTLTKRRGWNLNFNTTVDFCWRMWNNANQYFYIQYYNGYGETLIDYNKFSQKIRFGLVIKPKYFSEF